jgi:arsenate reductase
VAEALRNPRSPPLAHPLELLWMLTKEAPMTEPRTLPDPGATGPAVLVLCTGNSARSQMAAAFLRRHGGGHFPVYSAGTEPAAAINPLTVEVMRERGIDLAGRRPEHLRRYLGTVPVHTVIIVCDGAAKSCPATWPGAQRRLFWPFADPAAFTGSEEERREKFRELRDAIEAWVVGWLEGGGMAVAASALGETAE